jgi:hypothetical protein
MTFREFYAKRTPKFILLRGVIAYVVCLLIAFPLLWLFEHDYFARNGVLRVFCFAAIPSIGLSLLQIFDRHTLREPKTGDDKTDA